MHNPFSLYWNKDWTFQLVHMEGGIYIEAKGLGILIRKTYFTTENLLNAADNYSILKIRIENPYSSIGSLKNN